MWQFSGDRFGQVLPKFEPFGSGSIIIFQIQEPPDPIFELGWVPCTHYTFPNAKDYVSAKFYKKLK
jgi:hypothetical protein